MEKFVHLHIHSHYSLLQALPKIPDLIAAAKKNDMSALALTDNGNLYGAIEFYKACKKENIKPIIGEDAYVATRTRFDKQAGVDNRRARLVLLAENLTGYKNLIKLVTYCHLEITCHPEIDGHKELIEKIVVLGKKLKMPLAAAHDVYYISPDDKKARETLLPVQN